MRRIKGVSPIISVLLLIVIAVAAAVVTYGFVMGFIGGTTTTTPQTQARIIVEAVGYYKDQIDDFDYLNVSVRNVGTIPVDVAAVYVYAANGTGVVYANTSTALKTSLAPSEVKVVFVNDTINLSSGVYYVKVTTEEGAVATSEAFTVS